MTHRVFLFFSGEAGFCSVFLCFVLLCVACSGPDSTSDASVEDAPPVDVGLDSPVRDAASDGLLRDASSDPGLDVTVDTQPPPDLTEVSEFGARCDGVTDDSDALQRALSSGDDLVFPRGATCLIGSTLRVDSRTAQSIAGNNATIAPIAELGTAFRVMASEGVLSVRDLHIDGRSQLAVGWDIRRPFSLNHCDVRNLRSREVGTLGYFFSISSVWPVARLENSTCDNIINDMRNPDDVDPEFGDAADAARCVQIQWAHDGSPATLLIDNCTLGNVWGLDSDVIHNDYVISNGARGRLVVRNSEIFNAGRRLVKNTASDTYWENVTFRSAPTGHPQFIPQQKSAGMVATSKGTMADDTVYSNRHVFRNCTFVGSAHENRVIISRTDDILIADSTFVGARFAIYQIGGGACLQNNSIDDTFVAYDYPDDENITFTGPVVVTGSRPSPARVDLQDGGPPDNTNFECPRPIPSLE